MDATITRPSLLSAARSFIRKSAGTAVVVIAPLAAVSAANTAHAQALFFTTPGVSIGGSGGYVTSGYSNFFSNPVSGGASSVSFGANLSFTNTAPSGSAHVFLEFANSGGSGTLNDVPVAYDFTLGSGGGTLSSVNWHLDLLTGLGFNQQLASGSGLGHFQGVPTYFVANGLALDYYELKLYVDFSASNGFATVNILASPPNGAGFSLNAIPEPSTYAALFGLGALGVVCLARRRGDKHRTARAPVTV